MTLRELLEWRYASCSHQPFRSPLRVAAIWADWPRSYCTNFLQDAALPKYPPIAKAAHITGKVVVRVTVEHGVVVKTDVLSKPDVASGQRLLESPTVESLKTWRFAAQVTDSFTVTYTYEISGTETDEPTNAKVEILPSLDVKIAGTAYQTYSELLAFLGLLPKTRLFENCRTPMRQLLDW